MAAIKQNPHCALRPNDRKMLEIIIELAAGNVKHKCRERFLRGVSLEICDMALCRTPDMLGRIMVWRVRREEDRGDVFEDLARGEEFSEVFRVMEACVVQHSRNLLSRSLPLETGQHQDGLLRILLSIDRIDLHPILS
jgi:hypothetical protein